MRDRFLSTLSLGVPARPLALVIALVIALGTSSIASAQSWSAPVTTTQVVVSPSPEVPVPTHHVMRTKMLVAGVVMLSLGYVAAVTWGAYYLDSVHLGPLSCNDQYAGWHFVPVVGPVVGMFAGGGCIPDGLHVEEAVLPALFSVVQLVGMMLTIFGALGRDVPDDVPSFSFALDANGAFASARWSL